MTIGCIPQADRSTLNVSRPMLELVLNHWDGYERDIVGIKQFNELCEIGSERVRRSTL